MTTNSTGISSDSPQTLRARPSRERALDGLRGLAAFVVLVHHSMLLLPALAEPYYTNAPVEERFSWTWWMVHTPLHALWEGKSSVYVFFILSGLVLALPVIRSQAYLWRAYYPQRLIRLYLPVWGAVLLGVLSYLIVARGGENATLWLADPDRPNVLTPAAIAKDLTLLGGAGGLVSPLWSLRWEILFSLALPLYVWIAVKFRRLSWLGAAACFPLVAVGGATQEAALMYMPMFMLGTIAAVNLNQLKEVGTLISRRRWAWPLALALASFLLVARWLLLAINADAELLGASMALMLLGAAILVLAALSWRPLKRGLEWAPWQWLGTVSFSLYLIHEPIVVSLGLVLGPDLVWLSAPIAIASALLASHVFYRYVERPSHALARLVHARIIR